MKIIRSILLSFLALILILLVIGLFLPSTYLVKRDIVILSEPETVFSYVNDLEKMQTWSPWKALDPALTVQYGLTKVGQGASYYWQSEKSGEGTLTISESVPFSKIVTDLDFKQGGLAYGIYDFKELADGSLQVSWTLKGDNGYNIIGRYFGLAMESFVGPIFEDGLKRLKKLSENNSAQ